MLNVALALVPAGNDDGQAVFFADPVAGAADEVITLNTYTHVKFDDAKDELLRVANA